MGQIELCYRQTQYSGIQDRLDRLDRPALDHFFIIAGAQSEGLVSLWSAL
jgi:hypothetical protein